MKKVIKQVLIAAALTAVTAASASAQMALPRNFSLSKESKLWFEGTSTVRSFSCSAKKVDASVVAEPDMKPAEMVRTASLVIPVATLDCGNGKMNEHMRNALKADKNATVAWKLSSYKVEGSTVIMNGTLTIAGKENPIELRGAGSADNETIRLKGSKQIKMTEFGVKPPTLMLGTMKVGDMVTVSFDFVLNQ